MKRLFVEGLPGAGKTTTSKILKEKQVPVARDFGLAHGADDYPGNGTSIESILAIDDWFISKESERMQSDSGIFDRSYLGNLTYAYAYSRLRGLDSLRPTVSKYEKAVTLGRLALPEGLVYVDIDPELSIERQYKRVNEGVPLLDDFWRDRFFLQDLRDSYNTLFNSCTGIPLLRLDGQNEIASIADNIASFYDSLDTISPPLEPRLQLGQYVTSLEKFHDI
jgi:thymidylate kinase